MRELLKKKLECGLYIVIILEEEGNWADMSFWLTEDLEDTDTGYSSRGHAIDLMDEIHGLVETDGMTRDEFLDIVEVILAL